jgi:hypothetical protein
MPGVMIPHFDSSIEESNDSSRVGINDSSIALEESEES